MVQRDFLGQFEGFSSAADGADLLFAGATLERMIPLQLLLPGTVEEFRGEIGDAWLSHYDQVIAEATHLDCLPKTRNRGDDYACLGIEVVRDADIFVAVWNGKPARGAGGTAEVVALARSLRLPLLWVHSETGEIVKENWPDRPQADEKATEWSHIGLGVRQTHKDGPVQEAQFFDQLDRIATTTGPFFRRMVVWNLLLHALAISVAVVGLKYSLPITSRFDALAVVKLVLLLCALAILGYARFKALHHTWIDCRFLTEILRGWKHSGPFLSYRQFRHLWRSIQPFSRCLKGLYQTFGINTTRPPDGSIEAYIEARVTDQITYYTRTASALRKQKKWLDTIVVSILTAAFIAAALYAIRGGATVGILTVLLPLCSMTVLAIKQGLDLDNRVSRYSEMASILKRQRDLLSGLHHRPSQEQVIMETEQIMMNELKDWYGRTSQIHLH